MKSFIVKLVKTDTDIEVHGSLLPSNYLDCSVYWRGLITNSSSFIENKSLIHANTGFSLAYAYRKWGSGFSEFVEGSFSCVIVDHSKRTVTLAGDELGLTPLFYTYYAHSLIVSSHLEKTIPYNLNHDLDEEYIADYCVTARHLGSRTPFNEFKRLEQGTFIKINHNLEIKKYHFNSFKAITPLMLSDPEEYIEQLKLILFDQVRAFSIHSNKTICELSGGLDSSTVYGIKKRLSADVMSFSYLYHNAPDANEFEWISAILGSEKENWHSIDADNLLPYKGDWHDFIAEPSLALVTPKKLQAFDFLAKGLNIDNVLTGYGGDTVFYCGYSTPIFLADDFLHLRFKSVHKELNKWAETATQKRPYLYNFRESVGLPLLNYFLNRDIDRDPGFSTWFCQDYQDKYHLKKREIKFYRRYSTIDTTCQMQSVLAEARDLSVHSQRPGLSYDIQHPFMSKPLLKFMQSLPNEIKYSPQCDRLLQRHAIKNIVPDIIRLRSSKGTTMQTMLEGLVQSEKWMSYLSNDPLVVDRGYIDNQKWKAAIIRVTAGQLSNGRRFQAIVNLEAWLRQLDKIKDIKITQLKKLTVI